MFLSFIAVATLGVAAPLPVAVHTETRGILGGRITDTLMMPIAGAEVMVLETSLRTHTDRDGQFQIQGIPEGVYAVSVRAIGFKPAVRRVSIGAEPVSLNLSMTASIIELAAIQTTATPLGTSALDSPQPLAVVQGDLLESAQAPSLGDVIESQPGMRSLSTGNGVAKPVIRGLTGNRVLVLSDGLRVESQQWGDEHAPNVETASAQRIEIVRGPASVLYGSDALGGVVNVIPRPLLTAADGQTLVQGSASASYASNGAMPDGSITVDAAHSGLGFRATASGRNSGNIVAPSGPLANSGLSMSAVAGSVGWRGERGSLVASYSNRDERLEFHEDPVEEPGATPLQRILNQRATITGNLSLGSSRVEIDAGWERNRRREFEDRQAEDAGSPALGLLSSMAIANLHLHHAASDNISGVVGISGQRTTVDKFGLETLVPGSATTNIAGYLFEQVDLDRWLLSGGFRVDHRQLSNDSDADLGIPSSERSWTAVSGNLGALLRLNESAAVVFNVGRGFRAPSAFELFANGVHEGVARFEVGSPDLVDETSLNVDLALRVQSSKIEAELGVYRNAISNYIFPSPTNQIDPESGFVRYEYSQGNALLRGIEANFEWHLVHRLHLRGALDYTVGENVDVSQPLPFVAPLRLTGAIRYEAEGSELFWGPFLELGMESNSRQTRLAPDDIAPNGYTIVTGKAGGTLRIGNRDLRLNLQVKNLFDVAYRSFMSRYKLFADEPGRSFIVRVGVDF